LARGHLDSDLVDRIDMDNNFHLRDMDFGLHNWLFDIVLVGVVHIEQIECMMVECRPDGLVEVVCIE
jgi:hypothetical protein